MKQQSWTSSLFSSGSFWWRMVTPWDVGAASRRLLRKLKPPFITTSGSPPPAPWPPRPTQLYQRKNEFPISAPCVGAPM
jgi:hypothetical protein